MLWISILQTMPNASAAIRIHGVFDSLTTAQEVVQQQLAHEQIDVGAYILDELDAWLPL